MKLKNRFPAKSFKKRLLAPEYSFKTANSEPLFKITDSVVLFVIIPVLFYNIPEH